MYNQALIDSVTLNQFHLLRLRIKNWGLEDDTIYA